MQYFIFVGSCGYGEAVISILSIIAIPLLAAVFVEYWCGGYLLCFEVALIEAYTIGTIICEVVGDY